MRTPRILLLIAAARPQAAVRQGAVLFEGSRLIVGDGSASIENSAFVMENNTFTHIGKVYLRDKELDRAAMRAAWMKP